MRTVLEVEALKEAWKDGSASLNESSDSSELNTIADPLDYLGAMNSKENATYGKRKCAIYFV